MTTRSGFLKAIAGVPVLGAAVVACKAKPTVYRCEGGPQTETITLRYVSNPYIDKEYARAVQRLSDANARAAKACRGFGIEVDRYA